MTHEAAEVWSLPTRRIGRRALVFPRLESTNTHALSLASDPANHGLSILANEQTAGRGQRGRSWLAEPGSSVLLSVLIFPPPALCGPALLTAWAAVSVCETILQAVNLQAGIKWPNDVLLGGKKVCGILLEQKSAGSAEAPVAVVVGIGLNVLQPAQFFIDADLPHGASLASISGEELSTRCVAETLLLELDEEYDRLLGGDTSTLEITWKWRLGLLGKYVIAELPERRHEGRLVDVSFDAIVLDTEGDGVVQLRPELVKRLWNAVA